MKQKHGVRLAEQDCLNLKRDLGNVDRNWWNWNMNNFSYKDDIPIFITDHQKQPDQT